MEAVAACIFVMARLVPAVKKIPFFPVEVSNVLEVNVVLLGRLQAKELQQCFPRVHCPHYIEGISRVVSAPVLIFLEYRRKLNAKLFESRKTVETIQNILDF